MVHVIALEYFVDSIANIFCQKLRPLFISFAHAATDQYTTMPPMAPSSVTMSDESELWAMANWGPPDLNLASHIAGLAAIDAFSFTDPNEAMANPHTVQQLAGTSLRATETFAHPMAQNASQSCALSPYTDVLMGGKHSSLELQHLHAAGEEATVLQKNVSTNDRGQVWMDSQNHLIQSILSAYCPQFNRDWEASMATAWISASAGPSLPVHSNENTSTTHRVCHGSLPLSKEDASSALNFQSAMPHQHSQHTMPIVTNGKLPFQPSNTVYQQGLADVCNIVFTEQIHPNDFPDDFGISKIAAAIEKAEDPTASDLRCITFVPKSREQINAHQSEDLPPYGGRYRVNSDPPISSGWCPRPHTKSSSFVPDNTDVDTVVESSTQPPEAKMTCPQQILFHPCQPASNKPLQLDCDLQYRPKIHPIAEKTSLIEEMREDETEESSDAPSGPVVPSFMERLAEATQGLPEKPIPMIDNLPCSHDSVEWHIMNEQSADEANAHLSSYVLKWSNMAERLPARRNISKPPTAGVLSPEISHRHKPTLEEPECNKAMRIRKSAKRHLIQAQKTQDVRKENSLSIDESDSSSDPPPTPMRPERHFIDAAAAAASMTEHNAPDTTHHDQGKLLKRNYHTSNNASPDACHVPTSPAQSNLGQRPLKRAKVACRIVALSTPKAEAPAPERRNLLFASNNLSSPPSLSTTVDSARGRERGGGERLSGSDGGGRSTKATTTTSTRGLGRVPAKLKKTSERKDCSSANTNELDDEEQEEEEGRRKKGQSSFVYEMIGLGGAKRPSPRKTRKQRRNEEDAKPNAKAAVQRRRSGASMRVSR